MASENAGFLTNPSLDVKDGQEHEQNSRKVFHFLDLPSELRDIIYHMCLQVTTKSGDRKALSFTQYRLHLQVLGAILAVNKQIRAEALPIFFGHNILQVQIGPPGNSCDPRCLTRIRHSGSRSKFFLPSLNGLEDCFQVMVPPYQLRPLITRLDLTIQTPKKRLWSRITGRKFEEYEELWKVQDVDWLHMVRESKSIGFTRVDHLVVRVLHARCESSETEAIYFRLGLRVKSGG